MFLKSPRWIDLIYKNYEPTLFEYFSINLIKKPIPFIHLKKYVTKIKRGKSITKLILIRSF